MKFIRNLGTKLNSSQKTIVAIAVPLVLFVVVYVIADEVGQDAFEMSDTWLIWALFIGIVGYFEFHLYSDNNK